MRSGIESTRKLSGIPQHRQGLSDAFARRRLEKAGDQSAIAPGAATDVSAETLNLDLTLELVSGRNVRFSKWNRTTNAPTLCSMTENPFPATEYFLAVRVRPDRAIIREEWIRQVISQPIRVTIQADGRLRLWAEIAEAGGRVLRVVLLPDRLTVHNAFFDRSYKP